MRLKTNSYSSPLEIYYLAIRTRRGPYRNCYASGGMGGECLETSDLTALIAVVIAFGSMLLAGRSYTVSKKALKLSQADHEEKKLPVIPYLIDSFTFSKDNERYCAFSVSYTNESSAPQSLKVLDLEVGFVDEEGISGNAISPLEEDISPTGISEDYKKLCAPLNLSPKETISGWATFKIPRSSHRRYTINSYCVVGKSVDGKIVRVESYLLRHHTDEKNEN